MKHILFAVLGFASSVLSAQEAFVANANEASGASGSLTYSVGQLITSSQTTANTTINVGIQLSLQAVIVTLSNPEVTSVQLTAKAYPNPSTDFVVLSLTDTDFEGMQYALYNLNGGLVSEASISEAETSVDLSTLAVGTYVLRVTQYQNEIKTFKIILK